jgi:hypothetical protein
VYIATDGGDPAFVASNSGWGAFGTWLDALPGEANAELLHLWEHGWTEPAKAARDQLAAALTANPPDDPDVRATAAEVAGVLADAAEDAAVTVTGGLGPAGGDGEGGGQPPGAPNP